MWVIKSHIVMKFSCSLNRIACSIPTMPSPLTFPYLPVASSGGNRETTEEVVAMPCESICRRIYRTPSTTVCPLQDQQPLVSPSCSYRPILPLLIKISGLEYPCTKNNESDRCIRTRSNNNNKKNEQWEITNQAKSSASAARSFHNICLSFRLAHNAFLLLCSRCHLNQ